MKLGMVCCTIWTTVQLEQKVIKLVVHNVEHGEFAAYFVYTLNYSWGNFQIDF